MTLINGKKTCPEGGRGGGSMNKTKRKVEWKKIISRVWERGMTRHFQIRGCHSQKDIVKYHSLTLPWGNHLHFSWSAVASNSINIISARVLYILHISTHSFINHFRCSVSRSIQQVQVQRVDRDESKVLICALSHVYLVVIFTVCTSSSNVSPTGGKMLWLLDESLIQWGTVGAIPQRSRTDLSAYQQETLSLDRCSDLRQTALLQPNSTILRPSSHVSRTAMNYEELKRPEFPVVFRAFRGEANFYTRTDNPSLEKTGEIETQF